LSENQPWRPVRAETPLVLRTDQTSDETQAIYTRISTIEFHL